VLAALGPGGKITGSKGALRSVLNAPLGTGRLAVVALGLLCFAVWRALQALADADHLGREPKALARRAAYAGSAVIYAALSVTAVRVMIGLGTVRDQPLYLNGCLVGSCSSTRRENRHG